MPSHSKLSSKKTKLKLGALVGRLDVASPATATAFREAAKAYTQKAIKTKASAVKTLHQERILKKGGGFTKAYT